MDDSQNGSKKPAETGSAHITSIFRIKSKKGIDQWISWVLLLVFSVLLASIVSYWMKDYITETSGDMTKRAHTTEYCDGVGIEIQDLVAKNSQTLNMKVINTYNLAINKIIFRVYDADNYILVNMTNVTIKPGQNKTIEIPKNETVSFVEAVPVIIEDGEQIICNDKTVFKNISG
ncbi:MAG: hypothetical protein NT001_05930 [Candidatus Woesearchaeota archaeon]|nr:hypothetical protein [Candidatus Woesearchaeota archaeon]